MKIKVLVFSLLREKIGSSETEIQIEEGISVGQLLDRFIETFPDFAPLRSKLKVSQNRKHAGEADPVIANAEIAIFPPVSGG